LPGRPPLPNFPHPGPVPLPDRCLYGPWPRYEFWASPCPSIADGGKSPDPSSFSPPPLLISYYTVMWAVINAQLPACRYLLEQGAGVNALGGDLVTTPMQWAPGGSQWLPLPLHRSAARSPWVVPESRYQRATTTPSHPCHPLPHIQSKRRLVLIPIQYHEVIFSLDHLLLARSLRLSKIRQMYKKCCRHFISHVLTFFAASDGIVNENLVE
jgi:hypothetical protein